MTDTSDEISADAPVTVNLAQTDLKAGALRLPSIFMQSLTMVGPGIAALFYTPVVVSQAGLAAPLAYPIAFLIVLVTAIVLAQLARGGMEKLSTATREQLQSADEVGPRVAEAIYQFFRVFCQVIEFAARHSIMVERTRQNKFMGIGTNRPF